MRKVMRKVMRNKNRAEILCQVMRKVCEKKKKRKTSLILPRSNSTAVEPEFRFDSESVFQRQSTYGLYSSLGGEIHYENQDEIQDTRTAKVASPDGESSARSESENCKIGQKDLPSVCHNLIA